MKKNISRVSPVLLLILAFSIFCAATAFNDRSPGADNAISRVYKSELPAGTHNEEIARILVQRMMEKYSIGTRGWTEWVWAYEVKEIRLHDGKSFSQGVSVVIDLKPLFPDFWRDIWSMKVHYVENGRVRVAYLMVIDDKGDYYEIRGPFSGG